MNKFYLLRNVKMFIIIKFYTTSTIYKIVTPKNST